MRTSMLFCLIAVMALALTSCGGNAAKQTVENPYLERAHDFSVDGMAAMRRERWRAAERAFSRALLAAQLSDDIGLVRLSWYNLGVVRSAMNHLDTAEEAFRRCMALSDRQGDKVMRARAGLALALMQVRHGQNVGAVVMPQTPLPADVYLQQARLAQLQGDSETAERAYRAVISKSDRAAAGLRMKADAYMGLAILQHKAHNDERARTQVEKALAICRDIGAPHLTAHALFLSSKMAATPLAQRDYLERALAIYTALNDARGQRESLEALQALVAAAGDAAALARIRLRLQALKPKGELSVPGSAVVKP